MKNVCSFMLLTCLVPCLVLVTLVDGQAVAEICYDDLGCFSNGGHFFHPTIRPLTFLPQSPDYIDVKFALYRRNHVITPQYLIYNDDSSLSRSDYDGREKTIIIIHGFLDSGNEAWMKDMKQAFLLRDNSNVIQLDWSKGNQFPYTQATANTRVVGAVVARMIKWLEMKTGTSRENFHLAGHSLGAHISGYAGERLHSDGSRRQLSRISGLDPAGPYFEGTHYSVRLDPTDAKFVDAIHTDGDSVLNTIKLEGGFGMMQSVGHIDFYPNGGMIQPDCSRNPITNIIINGIIEGTKWTVACYHLRVMPLYTNTILHNLGDFRAYECDSYENFKAGKCLTCSSGKCALMGWRANEWNHSGKSNVKMFLDTAGKSPFDMHHYHIRISISSSSISSKRQYGELYVKLTNDGGVVSNEILFFEKDYINVGQTYEILGTDVVDVNNISNIIFRWKHKWWFAVSTQSLYVSRIEIIDGFSQKRTCYDLQNTAVVSNSPRTVKNSC